MMGLYIKNEETQRLAKEMAELTGESVTVAVTQALRQRIDGIRRERGMEGTLHDRLIAIAKESAAHMKEPWKSMDHGDLLYDERGLPRRYPLYNRPPMP